MDRNHSGKALVVRDPEKGRLGKMTQIFSHFTQYYIGISSLGDRSFFLRKAKRVPETILHKNYKSESTEKPSGPILWSPILALRKGGGEKGRGLEKRGKKVHFILISRRTPVA